MVCCVPGLSVATSWDLAQASSTVVTHFTRCAEWHMYHSERENPGLDGSATGQRPEVKFCISTSFPQSRKTLSLKFPQIKEVLTSKEGSKSSLFPSTWSFSSSLLMTYELLTALPMSELKFMYWLTGRRESFRVRMWKFFFFPHWRSLQTSPVPGCLPSPTESWPNMSRAIYCYCRWASCWRPSQFSSGMTLNQLANRTQIIPVTHAETLPGVVTGPSLPRFLTHPCQVLDDISHPVSSWSWSLSSSNTTTTFFSWARHWNSLLPSLPMLIWQPLSTCPHLLHMHPLDTCWSQASAPASAPAQASWTWLNIRVTWELKNRDAYVLSSDSDLNQSWYSLGRSIFLKSCQWLKCAARVENDMSQSSVGVFFQQPSL